METLRELLKDERYLGADVGILAALHTWGRTLIFHPHIHLLITGGGLAGEVFKGVRKDFLLPPSDLSAELESGSIVQLEWQDQSQEESGYIIDRITGTHMKDTVSIKLPENTINYIDSALTDGTEYRYQIRSYRDSIISVPGGMIFVDTGDKTNK